VAGFLNFQLVDSLPRIKEMLLAGEGDAAFSADNTQRIVAIARDLGSVIVRHPVTRQDEPMPTPLLAVLPSAKRGHCFVLSDAGAILDPQSHQLMLSALLAGNFWKALYNRRFPRYGVLGYGEEVGKQRAVAKTAYDELKAAPKRTVKVIEAKEALLEDRVEIVIPHNAEIGNYFLKTAEASIELMSTLLREEVNSSIRTKLGGALAAPAFDAVKERLFHEHVHGAMVGGIRYPFMKHHGRTDENGIFLALQRLARLSYDRTMLKARAMFLEELEQHHPDLLPKQEAVVC
jgi:glycerol-3-phosphate acyltransferase PlsX